MCDLLFRLWFGFIFVMSFTLVLAVYLTYLAIAGFVIYCIYYLVTTNALQTFLNSIG